MEAFLTLLIFAEGQQRGNLNKEYEDGFERLD